MKLLLLHPLPLDGSVFDDDLRSLVDSCVAPTLYRTGDRIGAWAEAALDAVGDGPVVVVGNSIGGSCAIEIAHLAPTKVSALVLCGAKPGHRPEPALRDEALRVLAEQGLAAAWRRYWLSLFGPRVRSGVVDRAWRSAASQGLESIGTGVAAFHSRPDRADFLRSWPRRVLVVSGDHDIAPDQARRLAIGLPAGSFHRIDQAGHYVPLEAPAALTAVVAGALAEC